MGKFDSLRGTDDLGSLPLLLAALGADYEEVDGWRGRQVGPGEHWDCEWVIDHHTAAAHADGHESLRWLVHGGLAGVRAPYAHALIGREPKIFLIAAGRANHAGVGGPFKNVPKDSMNAYGYGIEVEAPGRAQDFAPGQFDMMCKLNAAVLWLVGQPVNRVIRHKDWTDGGVDGVPYLPTRGRKVDIRYSLDAIRALTQKYLTQIAGAPAPPKPKPPVAPRKCDLSKVKKAARRDPERPAAGVTVGAKDDVLLVERALVDLGLLQRKWADGSYGTMTKEAYAKWQRRLGYTGKDADGIPGHASLKSLGRQTKVKSKFTVIA